MEKDYLILKRASASRPSGEWNDDDYDVLADGVVVGRIMKANAAPVGAPWMWRLLFDFHEARRRTATSRRARLRWRHSRRAGGENEQKAPADCPHPSKQVQGALIKRPDPPIVALTGRGLAQRAAPGCCP